MIDSDATGAVNETASHASSVAAHFRSLLRVLPLALLIGLIVGLLVGLGRAWLAPPQYQAEAVARISTQTAQLPAGDAYIEELRAPYTALITDDRVIDSVQGQLGGEQVKRSDLAVAAGLAPTTLRVVATGESAARATAVAAAAVTALDQVNIGIESATISARVAEMRTTVQSLESQIGALEKGDAQKEALSSQLGELTQAMAAAQVSTANRLVLLTVDPPEKTSPKPVAEGAVAAVVAAIAAAEVLAWRRRRTDGTSDETTTDPLRSQVSDQ